MAENIRARFMTDTSTERKSMIALVGYTGFVGSNIYEASGGTIDKVYNSKNIEEAYGLCPDLLIYSGLRAEKYLANNAPDKDMELIYQAEKNIEAIGPKQLVLISTVDVLKEPNGKDEDCDIDIENLHPYGLNRYRLEQWVREKYPDALIIRLPGLYGANIKKNFIYDYINVIPFMLKEAKMDELEQSASVKSYYELLDNGFYRLKENITANDRAALKETFKQLGFTALNFTDSRNVYQFYNLANLWQDINTAISNGINLWHPATEPVSAGELYKYLTGEDFINEIATVPVFYDYRTKYAEVFGGTGGYIDTKENVLSQIKAFVNGTM